MLVGEDETKDIDISMAASAGSAANAVFTSPVETTLSMLLQEARAMGKRVITEDRPDLIPQVAEYVSVAERLAKAFDLDSPVDPVQHVAELKKRFLLSTTLKVVAGIFTDDAVASPLDPTPLRRNTQYRLGVGLADHRQSKVAIDAPHYQPDQPCYGIVLANPDHAYWYMVRETGDLSYVLSLDQEWIKGFGSDMVIARDVLGLGREAFKMAEEAQPGIREWITKASYLFQERSASLGENGSERSTPSFYHFGKGGFCRQPWADIEFE